MARATSSASSGVLPALAATQQATGAATRSDECAASPATSSRALNSAVVGGAVPSSAANSVIHSFAFTRGTLSGNHGAAAFYLATGAARRSSHCASILPSSVTGGSPKITSRPIRYQLLVARS